MPILLYAIPIILLFFLFSGGKKKASLDDFFKGGTKETDEAFGGSKYGTPSITKTKADSISIALREEMGKPYFTSESKLLTLLKGLNEADYIMIFDSFGIVQYSRFFNAETTHFGNDFNLTQWLTYEVESKNGVSQLKKQFPNFF